MAQFGLRPLLMRWHRRLEIRRHELLYLFFELTRRCNLNCLHCGSDCTAQPVSREMSLEDWRAAARYIHKQFGSQVFINLTGGEPILFHGLLDLTRQFWDQQQRWGLVSNGTLLTKDLLHQLLSHGMESLTLSLDGPKETHDRLRGVSGSFDRLRKVLELAGQAAIPRKDVVTSVHPGNLSQLDEIAHLLLDAHIPAWRLFRIFPTGRAKDHSELALSLSQTRQLLEWIRRARPHYRPLGLEVSASCEGCLDWALDRCVRDFPYFCRSGVHIASILADGSFTGCSNNSSRFYCGNWFTHDFRTQWDTAFQKLRNRDWARKGKCGACDWWPDCQGGPLHLWADDATAPGFCYRGIEADPAATLESDRLASPMGNE